MTMQQDLRQLIAGHIIKTAETCEELMRANKALDAATIEQMWSLYKLVLRDEKFSILNCNPPDHLAVSFAGCYCGIEPDGYMHS